jgi:hypothetical protein
VTSKEPDGDNRSTSAIVEPDELPPAQTSDSAAVPGEGAAEPRPSAALAPAAPVLQTPAADDCSAASEPGASVEAYEAEVVAARAEVEALQQQVDALQLRLAAVAATSDGSSELVELDDERILQEVGIYRYHHPLENAAGFRTRLDDLEERIKSAVKSGNAVLASDMFTFNNSLARGRKMTTDLSKLMLRAYNAEADNAVRSLRAGNIVTAKKRLDATAAAVAKLGAMMEMRINPLYHQLRLEELELTSDYLMKVQEEREAARDERERLREQRKVEKELAEERERLGKERAHYANALEALRASGSDDGAGDLVRQLAEIDQAIEQNDYRRANIRAGYVYVISNPGAFGRNVVKIGLTRRLEPMERVYELGGASVPFPFDVHALFFSEDAVTLETELHHHFADRRLNQVNQRREFFFATPAEVREVLASKVGSLLEFTEEPEATQYLQSKGYWPATTEA